MKKDCEKGLLTGEVYSNLWVDYKGKLFDQYTYDLWYRWNKYDQWLDPEIAGKVVLDAGCGSGRAMAAMLAVGAKRVFGIDISPKNIQIASENLQEQKEKVTLKLGSLLEMPFENESFDVVHCYGVLHHTTDPYGGFKECCRVLKKGGILFIAQYCRGGLMNFLLDFARFFSTRDIPPLKKMKRFSKLLFGHDKNHLWYAILDGLYAPIRNTYSEEELRDWYRKNNLSEPIRYFCDWFYYRWPTFFSGKDRGLIILKGIKM